MREGNGGEGRGREAEWRERKIGRHSSCHRPHLRLCPTASRNVLSRRRRKQFYWSRAGTLAYSTPAMHRTESVQRQSTFWLPASQRVAKGAPPTTPYLVLPPTRNIPDTPAIWIYGGLHDSQMGLTVAVTPRVKLHACLSPCRGFRAREVPNQRG